ncbi:MAG TPA: toll/interleukin-1 receptor domain-containing protein [Candidatus Angelobacter sp.]|nr:toll/interleukin-1 receptor domain-containing protein [Candidatus Angelobacter sp.]
MPDTQSQVQEYAHLFSDDAKETRKQLPPQLVQNLYDIVDGLAVNPDAYPDRTRCIFGDILLYKHPKPALEVTYKIDRDKRILFVIHLAAPVVQVKQIFISYSHADTEWFKKIRTSLQQLESQGLFQIWDDKKIEVGDKWLVEIKKALETAQVAILLVTQDFMQSPFIQNEELSTFLAKADTGLRIIWVAVENADFSKVSQFQAANDPKRPLSKLGETEMKQVLDDIVTKVKNLVN